MSRRCLPSSAGELLGPPHRHAEDIAPSHRECVLSCCRLITAFGLRREPEFLVFTLVFVERLLRENPILLLPCTLRPIVFTAVILALKTVNDEIPSGVMEAIGRAGLVHVDSGRLYHLEAAYLKAMAWNVSVCPASAISCVMRAGALHTHCMHLGADAPRGCLPTYVAWYPLCISCVHCSPLPPHVHMQQVELKAETYHRYMYDMYSFQLEHRAEVLGASPHLATVVAHLEQLDVSVTPCQTQVMYKSCDPATLSLSKTIPTRTALHRIPHPQHTAPPPHDGFQVEDILPHLAQTPPPEHPLM